MTGGTHSAQSTLYCVYQRAKGVNWVENQEEIMCACMSIELMLQTKAMLTLSMI